MTDASAYDAEIRASWEANAEAWARAVRDGAIDSRRRVTDDAIQHAVLARRPAKLLDLGCGEGWLVRWAGGQGITAVGLDGSAALIETARAAGGDFVHASYDELAARPDLAGAGFDVVVANYALLDEPLTPLLMALATITTPGATLLIQTLHPFAAGAPYADGWRREDFQQFGGDGWTPMPWYFRTIGSWVALLRQAGFAVDALGEPTHPDDGRPLSLLLEAAPEIMC